MHICNLMIYTKSFEKEIKQIQQTENNNFIVAEINKIKTKMPTKKQRI